MDQEKVIFPFSTFSLRVKKEQKVQYFSFTFCLSGFLILLFLSERKSSKKFSISLLLFALAAKSNKKRKAGQKAPPARPKPTPLHQND